MASFLIRYRDPEDRLEGPILEEVHEFEDWTGRATLDGVETGPVLTITAEEWAEDYAYGAADKHWHEVVHLPDPPPPAPTGPGAMHLS